MKQKTMRSKEQKLALLNEVNEAVKSGGINLSNAIKAVGLSPGNYYLWSKKFSRTINKAAEKNLTPEQIAEAVNTINKRRAQGMVLREAVKGTGIAAPTYYRHYKTAKQYSPVVLSKSLQTQVTDLKLYNKQLHAEIAQLKDFIFKKFVDKDKVIQELLDETN